MSGEDRISLPMLLGLINTTLDSNASAQPIDIKQAMDPRAAIQGQLAPA